MQIKTGVFLLAILAALGSLAATFLGRNIWLPADVADVVVPATMLAVCVYVGVSVIVIYGGNVVVNLLRTAVLLLSYWALASIGLLGVALILAAYSI